MEHEEPKKGRIPAKSRERELDHVLNSLEEGLLAVNQSYEKINEIVEGLVSEDAAMQECYELHMETEAQSQRALDETELDEKPLDRRGRTGGGRSENRR